MKSEDVLKEISTATETVALDASDTRPLLSDEEYMELTLLRNQLIALKADKSDISDALEARQAAVTEAQDLLDSTKARISEVAVELQGKLDAIIGPLKLEGQFSIADTSPHYITVLDAPSAAEVPASA